MQLFIVRHGEADLIAPSDSVRQLNENGTRESVQVGQWIAQQCKLFDYVLVSPYDRAFQTWQKMEQQGLVANKLVQLTELEPEADVATCINLIQGYCADAKSVLVVSHLPLVCHLVDGLVAETCPLFVTGAAALIELNDNQVNGHLKLLVSPEQAQQLSALRA
ncbi:phosphohistidine phosphatase SixA [Catenovulum sp. SX2]|uniref:phosphohistidine phosphatase SixA n=1 Tax=Catenovulum sp. SX2 TaxID=3398614 RepID=UPI003F856673